MSTQYDIQSSADVSGSASLSGVQQMSLLIGLQAAEGIAFILVSAATPDVASNPRFSRYLWFDTTLKQWKYYDTGTSLWTVAVFGNLLNTNIPINTITVNKIDESAATANQVIASNATNAYWANVIDLITNNTLPIARLVAGSTNDFFRTVSGAPAWVSLASVASEINTAITAYTVDKLSGKIASSLLQVNASNVASFVTWADFFDSTLPINTIKLTRIHGGGAANGQGLLWVSATNQWTPSEVSRKMVASTLEAIPTASVATRTVAHALTGVTGASYMRWVLVCTAVDRGFAVNDEVESTMFTVSGANHACTPYSDATNVALQVHASGSIYVNHKTTGVNDAIDRTKWSSKCYFV